VASDAAAADDRDDDGGSGCDVGGGQLWDDLSLFSGVSASRHDDPLSGLDAEDLRYISEALSSTCFRGKPGRSGSSNVPYIDGAMQLGPVSGNATTKKHCPDHVKGAPEVSRRRETTADRREGAVKHDVDAAREVHAPSTRGSHANEARGPAAAHHDKEEASAQAVGSSSRHVMQFHSAPVTELTSVPEFGMNGLIRSKIASIRTFGAHVFRVVAPETRPPSSRMLKRHTRDKLRVRVQTFPQYPTIVRDAFFGRPAADSSVKRKELRAQLPSEREKRLSALELKRCE